MMLVGHYHSPLGKNFYRQKMVKMTEMGESRI